MHSPNTGGSMPKGYWVSAYRTISDPEKLAAYSKLAGPAVKAGGGRTLVRGGRVLAHDAGIAERTVLIEFDSFEPSRRTRVRPTRRRWSPSLTASSATSASSKASTDRGPVGSP